MLYQYLIVHRDDKDFFDGIYIDELEGKKILLNYFLERYRNNTALLIGRSKQEIVSLTMCM